MEIGVSGFEGCSAGFADVMIFGVVFMGAIEGYEGVVVAHWDIVVDLACSVKFGEVFERVEDVEMALVWWRMG